MKKIINGFLAFLRAPLFNERLKEIEDSEAKQREELERLIAENKRLEQSIADVQSHILQLRTDIETVRRKVNGLIDDGTW